MAHTKQDFLYWFRDNPNRPLITDIEWATERYERKFGVKATTLLVNEKEEETYKSLGVAFNIKRQNGIAEGYLGVE